MQAHAPYSTFFIPKGPGNFHMYDDCPDMGGEWSSWSKVLREGDDDVALKAILDSMLPDIRARVEMNVFRGKRFPSLTAGIL